MCVCEAPQAGFHCGEKMWPWQAPGGAGRSTDISSAADSLRTCLYFLSLVLSRSNTKRERESEKEWERERRERENEHEKGKKKRREREMIYLWSVSHSTFQSSFPFRTWIDADSSSLLLRPWEGWTSPEPVQNQRRTSPHMEQQTPPVWVLIHLLTSCCDGEKLGVWLLLADTEFSSLANRQVLSTSYMLMTREAPIPPPGISWYQSWYLVPISQRR